ncbi:YsnF/AvaK domain-containing protein, partial [Streptacidiphilus griseoplanus]|uniref:YsnF/AvaK domain-containing protein n=1 Tax=Peterkaempfera griseoplana TaxID=66896 RepID=UPI000A6534A3
PTVEVSRAQPQTPAGDRDTAYPTRSAAAEHTHAAPHFAEAGPAPAHSTSTRPEHPSATRPGPSQLDVICREERVEVTTEWHVLGTARLRKYVVTEEVERRVPVVRERVRVERVPVSDADLAGLSEKEISEAVEEVTLREERPVVRKRMVPVERVRLVVERVTHEEVVRTQLRREQVKVHDGAGVGSDRSDLRGGGEAPHITQYNGSGPALQLEQPIA